MRNEVEIAGPDPQAETRSRGLAAQALQSIYPEIGAGGYTRVAGTVEFYLRIATLLPANAVVLDLGAGRGRLGESVAAHTLLRIIDLPSRTSRLVGADVDPTVLGNTYVGETVLIDDRGRVPLPDQTFDLIYSDWVIEHVENPAAYAAEVDRLLKPGGWFCARTPNKWGLTGLGSRVLPTNLKKRVIAGQATGRTEEDVFPTFYRMNTLTDLAREFPAENWRDCSYVVNAEPPYVTHPLIVRAVLLFWRLAPEQMNANIMCFKQKLAG